MLPAEVAAALRELQLLDTDCERLVFRIRAHSDHTILAGTDDDLDELIGFAAAEANNESNRRRQQRLDTAFDALSAPPRLLTAGDPMTLPEPDIARVQRWCAARVPDDARHLVRPTRHVRGRRCAGASRFLRWALTR